MSGWRWGASTCATYTADGTERTPAVPIRDTAGTVPKFARYGTAQILSLALDAPVDIAIETLLVEAGARHALNPSEVACCAPRL